MTGSMSIDGLVSGMDTSSMIEQMMALESTNLENVELKKSVEEARITVWKEITASLLSLKLDSYALSRETLFSTKTVNSSDSDVLDASVIGSPIDGTYTFTVNKLAQAHQMLSNGYEDEDSTTVGAGEISFEFGHGDLSPTTKLDFLNGQSGVARGSIKITDRNGNTATIDLSQVTDVQEVLEAVNNNDSIDVTATLNADGNGINIVGNSGSGNMTIAEVSGGSTAADLGILEESGAASIKGDAVYYITESTNLNLLNDGLGVRTVSGDDIQISMRDNTTIDIDLSDATRISDVINAIEAADSDLDVALVDDGSGNFTLQITDNSADLGGTLAVTAFNDSQAVADLGLSGTALGDTLTGARISGAIDTVMLKNLRGGNGIDLSQDVVMTLHDGSTYTVESAGFSSAVTLDEFIDAFNSDADASGHFRAELNDSGNGLQIVDLTSGSTDFVIASNATTDGTTGFNITSAGTFTSTIDSGDLDVKYLSENTDLDELNSGNGVSKGEISFTNKNGNSIVMDFSADYIKTLGDVIDKINTDGAAYSITASINETGDGILITDTSTGSNSLTVENYGGSFATDLNIKGTTTGTTIDGSFEHSIAISATDTLEDVRDKINDADIDVRATIINDGSVSGSYKLMLTSRNTGESGKIVVSSTLSGGEGLDLSTVARAQNAVFTLGADGIGSTPQVISKSSNVVTDVIAGISLSLKDVDSDPVTLTLSNDYESISTSISTFVESYNSFIDLVADNTYYDVETTDSGLLQGDYTINEIKNEIFEALFTTVEGLPSTMNNIGQVGLSFDTTGKLSLDSAELQEALEDDLDGVTKLFTYTVNVASSSEGASALSSGVEAGYSNSGAIDSNTSFTDFEAQNTGWMTTGGTGSYYEVDLGDTYSLQKFYLYSIDTNNYSASSSALKSFDFDYWDSLSSTWQTAKSYSANSSGELVYYFSDTIKTSKVRINDATGNDGYARITELEVYEARGIGSKLDDLLASFTDSVDGTVVLETETIEDQIDVYDEQIEAWQERLDQKEEYYREQFLELETVMQEFQSTSQWLSTQLDSIQSGWSLRDG